MAYNQDYDFDDIYDDDEYIDEADNKEKKSNKKQILKIIGLILLCIALFFGIQIVKECASCAHDCLHPQDCLRQCE